jgi:prepilin-type N-terminal cleavage/methylation domain-containing protein
MRLSKLSSRRFYLQKGFTLIEVLVGVAIFAAIGVALLNGLSAGYKSVGISRERVYAESLAKSQIESIKVQDYISVINYDNTDPEKSYKLIEIPAGMIETGYGIEIQPPQTIEFAGISGYELQSIAVRVFHNGDIKLTLIFYRTGLAL